MPSTDLTALLNNPEDLQRALQQAQANLYNAMGTAYGDLENVNKTNQKELSESQNISNNILKTVESGAEEITETTNLAKRQSEINQWVYGNKRETLFVYQMLLIAISLSIIFTYMWAKSIMGNGLYFMLFILMWLIFSFIVLNRAQYTDKSRDKKYWNRRLFREEAGAKIPVPSCAGISDAAAEASASINEIYSKLSAKY
jgi:hypothetical protein